MRKTNTSDTSTNQEANVRRPNLPAPHAGGQARQHRHPGTEVAGSGKPVRPWVRGEQAVLLTVSLVQLPELWEEGQQLCAEASQSVMHTQGRQQRKHALPN